MSHFYIVLPSNSSTNYFPDNTTTHFKTKLSQPISLNGDWEVGLSGIDFPHDWYTIGPNEFLSITVDDILALKPIPQGYYGNPHSFMDVVNRSVVMPHIRYEESSGKLLFAIPPGVRMTATTQLCELMGVDKEGYENIVPNIKIVVRPSRPYKKELLHTVYIYCDLIEKNAVGDVMVPLLAICDAQGKDGETIHKYYKTPRYLPLQKTEFDTVEIDIRTNTGEPVSFQSGPSTVTLHFRQAKDKYLIK